MNAIHSEQAFLELIGFTKRAGLDDSGSDSSKVNILLEKIRRSLEDYAGSG
jgi:hypothetical protein